MRVLVIGGTGFIGRHVLRFLADAGHDIYSFHRAVGIADPAIKQIAGDRKRLADSASELRSLKPDVVLDMIPYTLRDAEELASVFSGYARRIVAVSSADVYRARDRFCLADPGPPDPTPLTEESPLRERMFPYADPAPEPGTAEYATTYEKILVERRLASEPGLMTTILRLPMVHGPGDAQHRCFDFIKRMDDKRPFILLPADIATWLAPRGYVEDVAFAIALCVGSEQASGRGYHVSEAQNLTMAEWVRAIGQVAGWTGKVIPLPNAQLPQSLQHHFDPRQDWCLDTSRIRRELGYSEPTPGGEALERTIEWERANPPVERDEFDYAAEDAAVR